MASSVNTGDIFSILGMRTDSSQIEIKVAYRKMLPVLHPNNRTTGSASGFIALQDAYRHYLIGDDSLNCFSIGVAGSAVPHCRCGAAFSVPEAFLGRLDCECCSCFIILEEPYKELPIS